VGVGDSARAVGVNPNKGARALARGLGDPRQRRLNQRAAGGTPGGQVLGEPADRRLRQNGRAHDISSSSSDGYLISPRGINFWSI